MTEEERKYKVTKIENYEELSNSEQKKEDRLITCAMVALSIGVNAVAAGYGGNSSSLPLVILGSASLGGAVYAVKHLVHAISKKTLLDNQIDSLYEELAMDYQKKEEEEEERVRGGK